MLMATPPILKDSRSTQRTSRTSDADDVISADRDTDVDRMFSLSPHAAEQVKRLFT